MLRTILLVMTLVSGAQAGWAADQAPRAVTPYKAPRGADGHPSLDGIWSNASITRLERNPRYGADLSLSEDEVHGIEAKNQKLIDLGNRATDPNAKVTDLPADCSDGRGTNCNYNAAWTDPGAAVMRVAGRGRNGFITTPQDGRVPMRKDVPQGPREGRTRMPGAGPSDHPESRSLGERCILAFGTSSGPVMSPGLYNNTYQFVQTREQVAIVVEMVHDTRIVRLNAKHRTDGVRTFMGDSIGWWEGETLVVETTNFHPEQIFRGASGSLKVTERFTQVSAQRMHYGFWVEDPTVFSQPWGGEYEFSRLSGQIYEYACHEGNYGLANILSGARAEERTGVKTAPTNIDQNAAPDEEGEES